MLQVVHIQIEYTPAMKSHDYILRAHMNEGTLLNNVALICIKANRNKSPHILPMFKVEVLTRVPNQSATTYVPHNT